MKAETPRSNRFAIAVSVFFVGGLVALTGAGGQVDSDPWIDDGQLATLYEALGPESEKMWPEEYAWVFYREPGNPQAGVEIGFTESAESKVDFLAKSFPRPDLLFPIEVPVSDREMIERVRSVVDDRAAATRGQGPLGEFSAGFDVMEDLRTGEVVVQAVSTSEAFRDTLQEHYDFPVRYQSGGIGHMGSCTSRLDCDELRAGIQSRRVTNPTSNRCSLGFSVVWDGNVQMLSAGHCTLPSSGPDGDLRYIGEKRYHGPGSAAFGEVKEIDFGDGIDVERISRYANPGFIARGWIYNFDWQQDLRVLSEGSYAALVNGSNACRSGVRTGRACGSILNKHYSPSAYALAGLTDFVKFDACSGTGDSGGPVYNGNKALGVYDGWIDPVIGDCDDGTVTQSYFGPIDKALNAVGANLLIANPAP
jgi:hypothetical protein